MTIRIPVALAVGILALWQSSRAASLSNTTTTVETKCVERGVLSSVEVSNAIILARQCGLSQAVRLRTYYFQPISSDWNFGIEVRGAEVVSGRRVAYVTVEVYRHEVHPESVVRSLGKLWVARGAVCTNEFALFAVGGGRSIRVRMPAALPLGTADRILAAFAAKRIEYTKSNRGLRKEIEQSGFSTPDELEGPGVDGRYKARVGASHGREVEFTLEGERVRILSFAYFSS
jgi:hypothetical protein